MHYLLPFLLLQLSTILALCLFVRLSCALFSDKIYNQMRKHPVLHWIWAGLSLPGVFMFFGLLNISAWPPPSVERQEQRKKVFERVQNAGGWEAIRQGCTALATNYPDGLWWRPPRSNVTVYPNPQTEPRKHYVTNLDYGTLPPALAALNARFIRYIPKKFLRDYEADKDKPQVDLVQIQFFGMHSTGGHSTPYYGLEVPFGEGAENYQPAPSRGGVSGNRHSSFQKITNGVFEVY